MQNDTFFYIPIGKYIAETKTIDGIDHWSFHENLRFTYPGWVCNLVSYFLFSSFGFKGIYIFVILLTMLITIVLFNTLLKPNKSLILSLIWTIISVYFSQGVFAYRNQIYSFLVFILELFALDGLLERGKKRYFWILIFLSIVLVNVHDTLYPIYFIIMLPYLAEIILSKLKIFHLKENYKIKFSNFKNQKYLILLIIICIFTGFLTPLFGTAYTNMLECMSGVSTDFIMELQPVNLLDTDLLLFFVVISIVIIGFTKTKIKLKDLLFVFGFIVFSLMASRNIYFMYLIGTVSVCNIFAEFIRTYSKENFLEELDTKICNSKILIFFIIFFMMVYSIYNFSKKFVRDYVDDLSYPIEATKWIKENIDLDEARIWNGFNYGSYLELNGIKVFVDSRSGMYCEEVNEGVTVLVDWLDVQNGRVNFKEIFDKYEITHCLIFNSDIVNQYIYYDDNYELVYQDDIFSIYEKKNWRL